MGESLMQRRRVREEGPRVVNRFQQGRGREVTVPAEEAPANYVPAAAVIRRGRALSGFIGRKAQGGIPSVAVECADIRKNTGGEGGLLGHD